MIAKERLQLAKMMNCLGYLGLIPFALCIASFNANAELFGINTRIVFIAYSGIILSFLCGILWSHALSGENKPLSLPMLLLSNLICLMAWLVILIAPQQFSASISSINGGVYLCLGRRKSQVIYGRFILPFNLLDSAQSFNIGCPCFTRYCARRLIIPLAIQRAYLTLRFARLDCPASGFLGTSLLSCKRCRIDKIGCGSNILGPE